MKRIYMTLGLVAGLFTAVQAQKTIDLEITPIVPMDNTNYQNVATGEVVAVLFAVTNNGPDVVTMSDTLIGAVGLGWLNADLEGFIVNLKAARDIPVGATDTMGLQFENGVTELTDADGNTYPLTIPNDATVDTIMLRVYGVDYSSGSGVAFNDAGVSFPTDSTISFDAGGNNLVNVLNVSFGSVGVDDVKDNHTALSVYPNPVENGVLNIQYELKASAEVTVNVMDIMGRVLTSENINANAGQQTHAVNVANLSAGNYIIEISSTEGRGVSKFTIK